MRTLCRAALAAMLMLAFAAVSTPSLNLALAQDAKRPLFEEEPYDEVHFKDGNVVAVQRLPRPLPEKPKPMDKLVVRLMSNPEQPLEAVWKDIAQVKLFEQLILEETDRQVAVQKFDEAYEYYQYLTRHHPRLPGLDASLQNFLLREAQWWQGKGRDDQALALLNDLHSKNATFAGLEETLAKSVDKLVTGYLAKENFSAARRLLAQAQGKFPENATLAAGRQRLVSKADTIFKQAQQHYEQGHLNEARELAYAAVRIWPLEEAKALLDEAQNRSPLVVVGVTNQAQQISPELLDDWAARRASRLLHRTLLEYVAPGPQGGDYRSFVGELERQGLGKKLSININPAVRWSHSGEGLTGPAVARHLLAMARPGHPAYRADWAELFGGVQVRDVFEVEIDLRRAHVHPDRLLETALVPWELFRPGEEPEEIPTTGPYVVQAVEGKNVRYRLNPFYFAAGVKQPREILERYFEHGRAAVSALRAGEIQVLDRINPWDVDGLRSATNIEIEAYAAPSIHVLIPSGSHPLLSQRLYRRAILSGINRTAILDQLLGGPQTPGNQIVSGPFPAGRGSEDPLGYGYNVAVPPRPYNPRLAMMNATMAASADRESRKKRNEQPLEKYPPLILAHPPHDVAAAACRTMQRQLKLVGILVELKELPSGPLSASDAGFDLRYAELAIREPVVDAGRLFGQDGLAPMVSPYTRLAVQQLAALNDWRRARQKLHEIHTLVADDLSVMPLWQLSEHFAYHKALRGPTKLPVTLYQAIEQWESPPALVESDQ